MCPTPRSITTTTSAASRPSNRRQFLTRAGGGTGAPADFERVPLGGVIKQTDPQSALAFELAGSDSHQLGMIAPPAFDSAEEAGEMVELYWQALTRDVPFAAYESDQ